MIEIIWQSAFIWGIYDRWFDTSWWWKCTFMGETWKIPHIWNTFHM